MGGLLWLVSIVPNKVYNQFQKKTLWVSYKRIKLDGIRLDAGDISLTIQWYENISGVAVSYLVYRLYCYNPPQVQVHTQLVHRKISTTQTSGTV